MKRECWFKPCQGVKRPRHCPEPRPQSHICGLTPHSCAQKTPRCFPQWFQILFCSDVTSQTGSKFSDNRNYPSIPDEKTWTWKLGKHSQMIQKRDQLWNRNSCCILCCQKLIEVLSSCQQTMSVKPKSLQKMTHFNALYRNICLQKPFGINLLIIK